MAITLQQMRAANAKVNPAKVLVTKPEGNSIAVTVATSLGATIPAVRAWGDIVADSYRYHENVRRGLIS